MARLALHLGILAVWAVPVWAAEPAAAPKNAQAQKAAAQAKPGAAGLDYFETKVRPLLVEHCYRCHSAQTKTKPQAGLLLDSRAGWEKGGESGPAIRPGKPDESLLIKSVRHTGPKMPPDKKLDPQDIAVLEQWVKMGAPDPRNGGTVAPRRIVDLAEIDRVRKEHWSFSPPKKTAPPVVRNAAWARTEIDHFILAALQEKKLAPAAPADRQSLVRRLTFDLVGLPPTPEEVDAFVNDPLPTEAAVEKLAERLLASPHFGERWGRHWLDVARYAEDADNSLMFCAWRYRNYVIEAFNKDKPYDQFIKEQIAGDLLPAGDEASRDEGIIATGFLALGQQNDSQREDSIDDQIEVTTRGILGLTVACARCHDHKFDPIPTTDYYALSGIFRSADICRPFSFHVGGGVTMPRPLSGYSVDEWKHFAEVKKKYLTLNNGKKHTADEEAASKAAAELLEKEKLPRVAVAVAEGKKPADQEVFVRGDPKNKGPKVPRGVVSVLAEHGHEKLNRPQGSGRLELANWLASRANPLTARVAVNRVWKYLIGTGLVRTVDNLGASGEKPSHPELLDYLATTFVEEGWSVKRLIKRIVTSNTYQMSSARNAEAELIDPENRLLWHMELRRLEAEELRDAMLAFSGRLDRKPLVPSPLDTHKFHRGDSLDYQVAYRSIYLPVVRHLEYKGTSRFDVAEIFNGADPKIVVGSREVSIVPAQALYLLNSPAVLDEARHAAKRLLELKTKDEASRVDMGFRLALGRPASSAEKTRMLLYIKEMGKPLEAWTSFCHTLMAASEFQFLK